MCERPTLTDAAPELNPDTTRGASRVKVLPSPSKPAMLLPQHRTYPAKLSAQLLLVPAEMEAAHAIEPPALTGTRKSEVEPFPSWPHSFEPHPTTIPPSFTASVCCAPAAIPVTPLASPDTLVGVNRSVVVPSPIAPFRLSPQHFTAPFASSAQEW